MSVRVQLTSQEIQLLQLALSKIPIDEDGIKLQRKLDKAAISCKDDLSQPTKLQLYQEPESADDARVQDILNRYMLDEPISEDDLQFYFNHTGLRL